MENSLLYRYIIPDTSGIPLAPRIRTQSDITEESVWQAFTEWQSTTFRYETLFRYYVGIGRNPVFSSSDRGGPQSLDTSLGDRDDYRTLANFCRYIVRAVKGYIIGNAPEYEYADGDIHAQTITEMFHRADMEVVDADIIQDMSVYGRAFEVVYRSADDGAIRSVTVSPRDAFVAYTSDIEARPVFGAIRYAEPHDDRTVTYTLKVYTDTEIRTYVSRSENAGFALSDTEYHGFGRVPVIEYVNNREFLSDLDDIIALQNAYNHLLIDRIADKDAFVKSILVVTGQVLGMTPDELKRARQRLNDIRILQMDSDGSGASYLEHSLSEADVSVLQAQLKSDIHKFSMVPDMSDEAFANNASGVAMAFKLLGEDSCVADKVSNFQRGFRMRCMLYDYAVFNPAMSGTYVPTTDFGAMRVVFKFNIPQDLSYMATAMSTLVQAGILSKDTARQNLTIVADSDVEAEKVGTEADDEADRNRASFEDDYSTTPRNMGGGFGSGSETETEETEE